MYVNPKVQFPSDSQPDQVTGTRGTPNPTAGAAKGGGASPASNEDTVSLSSAHGDVQSLAASLTNVPEVRTDRIDSLRAQVSQGQYQPSSQKVADAIIREYSRVSQAAYAGDATAQ
jgi:flagellar biosynthesis anti-sigma factor FlgM